MFKIHSQFLDNCSQLGTCIAVQKLYNDNVKRCIINGKEMIP